MHHHHILLTVDKRQIRKDSMAVVCVDQCGEPSFLDDCGDREFDVKHAPCTEPDCSLNGPTITDSADGCLDCGAPVRPTPPEFRNPPELPDPPQVSKVEWWTGRALYCQRCFDALVEETEPS